MKGAVKCPYHAWSYSFDGRLIGTPNVAKDEVDRDSLGLWRVPVETWQGFVFVHLDPDPVPLEQWLGGQHDGPLAFARFNLDELRTGHVSTNDVQANWKILIENYNDGLHCPTVHPELVAVVPAFRKGSVFEAHRHDGGVAITGGRRQLHAHRPVEPPADAGPRRARFDVALWLHGVPQHVPRCHGHRGDRDDPRPP
jgi:Rieske 2Fe-2S family protein